jgi:hypothetical protein
MLLHGPYDIFEADNPDKVTRFSGTEIELQDIGTLESSI